MLHSNYSSICNCVTGLNSLQSGLHKQHMKDLFVELCLTVPVRLSSLLPYLPMLMDPLVSALNCSQTLISQGLRPLELCVDNLQPDFLYDHIQPVRADLMQVSESIQIVRADLMQVSESIQIVRADFMQVCESV